MQYKFLIYISYSYALPIGIPLEKEIEKRGHDVKWFADYDEGKKAIANKNNIIKSIDKVLEYDPHIILVATDNVPDFLRGLKVQVFHGFNSQKRPGKNIEAHFNIRGLFDLYCTQGPSSTSIFENLEKKHGHFKIIETGFSKMDPLFPLVPKQETTIPTIMIASTFTERLSLAYDEDVYKEIKKLSESGKYRFNMVLHPKVSETIREKWKKLANDQFMFYDTTDLVPLFKTADVMFADTTSAIQEFLLQKKPVVTFNHTFKCDYLVQINSAEAIERALIEALSRPEILIAHIDTFIKELHPYYDGQSSARIIDATIAYLHTDKSNIKSKPLNFIRKLKIRKQLNYFTLKSYSRPFTIPAE